MNIQFKKFLIEITWKNYHVPDLCAGSGCIGIALTLLNANIRVDLVDISSKALEIANPKGKLIIETGTTVVDILKRQYSKNG